MEYTLSFLTRLLDEKLYQVDNLPGENNCTSNWLGDLLTYSTSSVFSGV